MRAKDIMTTPVVTASPSTSLKTIAKILVEHDISAVPIVDDGGGLAGLVSEADIVPLQDLDDPRRHLMAIVRRHHVARLSSDVMATNVVTVREDEDVTRVAHLMHDFQLKRLPVVKDGRVVGIISRRDILKVLARSDQSIETELKAILDEHILLIGWFHPKVSDGIVTLEGPNEKDCRRLAEVLARGTPGVIDVRFEDAA